MTLAAPNPPSSKSQKPLGPLSSSDALALAHCISQLARSGVPLSDGLRAVAGDLPSKRLTAAAGALADPLAAGASLEAAIAPFAHRLPSHVRQLIEAAGSAQLTDALDELLDHERTMDDLGRRLRLALTYPIVLLGFLAVWIVFMSVAIGRQQTLYDIFEDFGTQPPFGVVRLKEFSRVSPRALASMAIVAVVFVLGARIVGGRELVSRLIGQIPLVGPAWRYRGLVDFCGLLPVFLRRSLTMEECLALTAEGTRDPAIRAACLRAVGRVRRGASLAGAIAGEPCFAQTLVNAIAWGEQNSTLDEVVRSSQPMWRDRFERQLERVRFVLPPIVFLLIATTVFVLIFGFFSSLIKLITDVT